MNTITKRVIRKEVKESFDVIINGRVLNTCDTEEEAKRELEELLQKQKERAEDFLIAEKLFGYIWINNYGYNRLVLKTKEIENDIKLDWVKLGKQDKLETEGEFYVTKDSPPNYASSEQFGNLLDKFMEKGTVVFPAMANKNKVKIALEEVQLSVTLEKKEEWHSLCYYRCLALKQLAVKYIKECL